VPSNYTVNARPPPVGEPFIARPRVVKPGRTQVFTACELYARSGDGENLVATGETLLSVVADAAA
jgi:acyl-coenzyme A thioesterase PaaI-like protein